MTNYRLSKIMKKLLLTTIILLLIISLLSIKGYAYDFMINYNIPQDISSGTYNIIITYNIPYD